jgi:hypothetical protein
MYAELAPFSDRLALTGAAFTIAGIPAYALARLAALRGDRAVALRHIAEARDLAARFRSNPWVARCDAVADRIRAGVAFEGWRPRALGA